MLAWPHPGRSGGEAVFDVIGAFLHVLLAFLGLTAGVETGSIAVCAIVMAAALFVVMLHAIASPRSARSSRAHPRTAIDVSASLAQSDPDAPGHPRSRAPGFAASAA